MSGHPRLDRRLAAATDRVRLYVRIRLGATLRNRFEPEDVVQEACAAALRARERYDDRGDEAFVKWVCRIAETTIRSLAEREGAAKRTPSGRTSRRSPRETRSRRVARGRSGASVAGSCATGSPPWARPSPRCSP